MKSFFTILIALLTFIPAESQRLVDVQFLFSLSKLDVSSLAGGLPVDYGVDLYKVKYLTPDEAGADHTASGLLCIPKDSKIAFPVACYQHGTVADRDDVPSNIAGGYLLPLIFSSFGYVVCAPDFVGLGDSPGTHLYVHAKTEASAGVDLMRAARELDADENFDNFSLNDQVFVTGYSQGGHAAMALHRELETNLSSEFNVIAAAPMSGPYSIAEKMIDFTLGDAEYPTVAYLAWVVLSYQRAYPELLKDFELENIFMPEYLEDIKEFRDEQITLWTLNDRIIARLINTVGTSTPKDMVLPEILEAIKNDPTHPLSLALADNDTYDWAPKAPTNLYYCKGDEQITFENSILAQEVMTQNGSTSVKAVRIDTDSNPLTHGGCVFGAALNALGFFAPLSNLLSATENITFDANTSIRYALGNVVLDIPYERSNTNNIMSIYSQTGQLVLSKSVNLGYTSHDITHLDNGMYVVTLRDENQLFKVEKLIKL